jgi:hypothetical protein
MDARGIESEEGVGYATHDGENGPIDANAEGTGGVIFGSISWPKECCPGKTVV